MNWRLWGFFIAVGILGGRLVSRWRRFPGPIPRAAENWNWWKLVLASFLTLFAELALIRWIGTEVRVFAYVKNLALLLCFLGFGLGCALARQRPRWQTATTALLGLIAIVRLPWRGPHIVGGLSQYLGGAQDIEIFGTHVVHDTSGFLLAVAIIAILLL